MHSFNAGLNVYIFFPYNGEIVEALTFSSADFFSTEDSRFKPGPRLNFDVAEVSEMTLSV